ncbi:MAG: transcriptional regulator, partial [Leptolyngbya sp. DLM2.Bin15]
MLAYLALHPHTPQSRQRLAFLLWPDSSETQARSNLRKELSYLRKAVPQSNEWLLADTKTVHWGSEVPLAVDVSQFDMAVRAADQEGDRPTRQRYLEQAIALYREDFLPDFENDWVVSERERLRHDLGRALDGVIALLEKQGKWAAAIAHAQHLLRLDNLNEAAYCTLMRLYGSSGDRASALQLYHQCMTLLRDELGIEPSTATRRMYEQLLMDDTPSFHSNELPHREDVHPVVLPRHVEVVQSPLVGRETEWMQIQTWAKSCLQRAHGKTPQEPTLLILQGEPGIGKTRQLEEISRLTQEKQGK